MGELGRGAPGHAPVLPDVLGRSVPALCDLAVAVTASPWVGFWGDSVPVRRCHPQVCADLCSHGQAHSFYQGVRTAWHSLRSRLARKVFLKLMSAFLIISYWT